MFKPPKIEAPTKGVSLTQSPMLTPPSITPTKAAPKDPLATTGNMLRDLFARLLTFSIGPTLASRGVPPGMTVASPMVGFSPVRIA